MSKIKIYTISKLINMKNPNNQNNNYNFFLLSPLEKLEL